MQEQLNFQNEPEGLSIKDLFFKYIRFWPLFILSVAFALFVVYVYLRYTHPTYQSTGAILIKDDKTTGGKDRFEELFMNAGAQNIQNEIEMLKSRSLIERVVRQNNFNINYRAVGKIKSPVIYNQGPFLMDVFEINDSTVSFNLNIKIEGENTFRVNNENNSFSYGQLFKNQYGVFRLQKNRGGIRSGEYIVSWQSVRSAASGLLGNLKVTPKAMGRGLLVLTIKDPHPNRAVDVINHLMVEYQKTSVEEKNEMAGQTLYFIDGRLVLLSHELDDMQRNLLNYQQSRNVIDAESQYARYFSLQGEADKQINEQQLRLNVAGMLEDYLRDKRNLFNLAPSSLGLEDATLNSFIVAYNQLQQERKSMIDGNVPPAHPPGKTKRRTVG